jgi:rhamnogalacturonyl hydrolase YesR
MNTNEFGASRSFLFVVIRVHSWTTFFFFIVLLLAVPTRSFAADAPAPLSRDQILKQADDIADAQIKALGNKVLNDWIWGVMEAGYSELSHVSPQGSSYTAALTAWAEKEKWTPQSEPAMKKNALIFADDFCIGQTYLDLFVSRPVPSHIDPLRARLDLFVDHMKTEPDKASSLNWYWCDALFMAPAVLSRMSAMTGDPKYIDAMDTEYWRTTTALYDHEEHLFYRDGSFIGKLDPNGKKIFWSRGEGWVVAGLALTLQYMPPDYPSRPKYLALFQQMVARLAPLQSGDGTWHASLLDPDLFDNPETSGTSLFVYAIAWGINNKLLDHDVYLPIAARGWNAMIANLRSDGLPGYVQPTGAAPKPAKATDTQLYATGAMLLDAVELAKLAPVPGK